MEFDDDIQKDLDDRNTYLLALVAQDLRNTIKYVNGRSLLAAVKRKNEAEKDEL